MVLTRQVLKDRLLDELRAMRHSQELPLQGGRGWRAWFSDSPTVKDTRVLLAVRDVTFLSCLERTVHCVARSSQWLRPQSRVGGVLVWGGAVPVWRLSHARAREVVDLGPG